MKKMKVTLLSAILVPIFSIFAAGCGNADTKTGNNTTDSSLNRPAPDNNSATNSSLADTAFSKDSTGKIPDTTHQR